MRISDWSSDVCSSDLAGTAAISVTISMISMSGRWGRPAMADLRRNISAKRRILAAPGIALALLGCGIAATIAVPPRPLLVWNASASAPMGLYRVGRPGGVGKGDMVIARLAEPYRSLAAKRPYLPSNVPLVKRA